MENFKITITKEISKKEVSDLLCSALEGGSNYWAIIRRYAEPEELSFRTSPDQIFKHLDYPLNDGGSITIFDQEGQGLHRLDSVKIVKGLKIMAEKFPKHYADFIGETGDAETGDVFLQCCLFGEVKYG